MTNNYETRIAKALGPAGKGIIMDDFEDFYVGTHFEGGEIDGCEIVVRTSKRHMTIEV